MHINQYYHLAERQEISAKTLLLKAGEIAKYTYFLEKGCIRIWFNSNGKDITFDVLVDGEGVSSVESFRTGHPSTFNIESLETCIVYKISRQDFLFMMQDSQAFKEKIEAETFKLLYKYQQLFFVKNKKQSRRKVQGTVAQPSGNSSAGTSSLYRFLFGYHAGFFKQDTGQVVISLQLLMASGFPNFYLCGN